MFAFVILHLLAFKARQIITYNSILNSILKRIAQGKQKKQLLCIVLLLSTCFTIFSLDNMSGSALGDRATAHILSAI